MSQGALFFYLVDRHIYCVPYCRVYIDDKSCFIVTEEDGTTIRSGHDALDSYDRCILIHLVIIAFVPLLRKNLSFYNLTI